MLALRLFGGLSLECDAGPVPQGVLQRRRLALLAVLALGGPRGLPRERVEALLWPDRPDDSAGHALEQLLYLTRRDLGRDVVPGDGVALRLNPEVVTSDLAEFEAAASRGDLASAVRVYAGPLLDGVRLGGTPELERWIDERREAWAQRYASALERLASLADRAGAHAEAADWWRRRAALDPYSAPATLGLMRALVAGGDRAAAIRQARVYESLVRNELGLEPDGAVAAFIASLATKPPLPTAALAGSSAAPPPPSPSVASSAPAEPADRATPAGARGVHAVARSRAVRLLVPTVAAAMVVAVVSGGRGQLHSAAETRAPATATSAIAVLPLADLSAERENDYFGDGLTEELIHALGRVPNLRVVARTSVFALKGHAGDVRGIGQTLGVPAVLEGSVRRAGDRVRVTVRLVDATTGYERWSESYDRRLADVLAVQREIADAVADRLTSDGSTPPPSTTATGADTRSYRAFEHYLRGRFQLNRRDAAALARAVDELRAAIAADPRYARAHAALAEAFNAMAEASGSRREQAGLLAQAEESARRAIELDPHLAEAHASLGDLRLNQWDWSGAAREYLKAIADNPSLAAAHERYATLLALQGRFDEAVVVMRRAQELDPLSLRIQGSAAYVFELARRYPAAEELARRLVAIDSAREGPRFRLGAVLLQEGRYAEAVHELEVAARLAPAAQNRALPLLGYAYARAGRTADARRLRSRVVRGLADDSVSPYFAAAYFGAVGEDDRAFTVLEDLGSRRESCLRDLAVDPTMDFLHADPRFARVLGAVGLDRIVERTTGKPE